ncbi:hypothetical protein FB565_000807 [Actinoplanes lutulentus]|uniref:Uncharacterized protein n=1 Tax=Actinoplanes lutulentus TaxID=1287878 RepID=A0A327ZKU2_9ACTN|nr:hypothetical protein [Actinoplanes lutulentus]MBB2941103.1 hypothetical protein [Actinoplanes lutulentus]RAK43412.1 hypothetical protein B0I29_101542 [Actinoplanes lutulentus]
MDQADVVADRQQFVARTAQLLLGAYLLALLVLAVAAYYGRVQVYVFNIPYLVVPAAFFGQAVWTTGRFRRATEPGRRRELYQRSAIETVLGLVMIGSLLYYWLQDPASFVTWM